MLIVHLRTKFEVSRSNGSLIMAIKSKAKKNVRVSMLLTVGN
jgi:hypothetical protein